MTAAYWYQFQLVRKFREANDAKKKKMLVGDLIAGTKSEKEHNTNKNK